MTAGEMVGWAGVVALLLVLLALCVVTVSQAVRS